MAGAGEYRPMFYREKIRKRKTGKIPEKKEDKDKGKILV
jgi:hypothetical protein